MFFSSSGMCSMGMLMRRSAPLLRAFTTSQRGAVSVDFVALAAAVIGLGFGVVSFTTAALDSSSTEIATKIDGLEIQTQLPSQGSAERSDTPQVDKASGSGGRVEASGTGGSSTGSRDTVTRYSSVKVSVDGLGSAGGTSGATVKKASDEPLFKDQWLFPD